MADRTGELRGAVAVNDGEGGERRRKARQYRVSPPYDVFTHS